MALLLFSCSKDSTDDAEFLSGNKSLLSFSIREMPDLVFSGLGQNQLETLLENPTDLTALTAVFSVSQQATAYIGNVTQQSGITKNDFTDKVTYTIEAEDGSKSNFSVKMNFKTNSAQIPIDSDATAEVQNLLKNLTVLTASNNFAFGQEFPLSFQLNSLNFDLNTSDCKDVSGDHPGVFGIDPHYMLYKSAAERQLHIDEARAAYENGAIVTFDFHQRSRTDGKIYYNQIITDSDKSLMYDIVNDQNTARTWFFSEIDEVLDIINNDLGFPVVFRLFHEMNGNWFWWGTRTANHSPSLYVDFFRLTVDYIKDRTDNVLFGWSPNWEADESYYPGDDYVDIVGIDYYQATKSALSQSLKDLTVFAGQHNKVAALTETGDQGYVLDNPDFWTDDILSVIEEGGSDIRLAWVLGWFNAPWDNSQSNLFIPNSNSNQEAKDDFIAFKNSDNVLFQEEVKALSLYQSGGD